VSAPRPALPPPSPAPPLGLWLLRLFAAFLRRELAEASRYRVAFLTRGAAFAMAAFSLYFFSRFVAAGANRHLAPYGGDYLAFGLVGLVAAELQHVGTSTLANRVRIAQLVGSLEPQLATPAPAWMVMGMAPIFELGGAFLRALVYLGGAALFMGVRLAPHPTTLLLATPLVLLTFAGLGMLTAAGTMLTRRSNPVAVVLGAASALLSGMVYPVSVLPPWLQHLGAALPLTHVLEVLRQGLLRRAPPAALAPSLAALAAFGLLSASSGAALFAWTLRRARVDGSLSHY
jgi:ABC-2 type transport system permease protein